MLGALGKPGGEDLAGVGVDLGDPSEVEVGDEGVGGEV